MKSRTGGKLATVLMVLVIALSATMVVQCNANAQGSHLGTVEGTVQTKDGNNPAGLKVILKDVSNNEVYTSYTSSGGYFSFDDMEVSHYKIKVPSKRLNKNIYFSNETEIFKLGEDDNVFQELEVTQETLEYELFVNVTADGESLSSAQIMLYESLHDYWNNDYELVDIENGTYQIESYEGEFILRVEAEGYPPYMKRMEINSESFENGTRWENITLTEAAQTPMVSGFLRENGETGIKSEMDVTLYNKTEGIILNKTTSGPYFEIGAVTGQYTLIIDAPRYQPKVRQLDIGENGRELGWMEAQKSGEVRLNTDLKFSDWQSLTVNKTKTIHTNSTVFEGLDYTSLGNPMMQIDFNFGGKPDMYVDNQEYNSFVDWLTYNQAQIISTKRLITVDGTQYKLQGEPDQYYTDLDALKGPITTPIQNEEIDIEVGSEYTPYTEVPDEDIHMLNLIVNNDRQFGNMRNYTYSLDLPTGFERVKGAEENIPPHVDVDGYTKLDIDPHVSMAQESSYLTLDIRRSKAGNASIELQEKQTVRLKKEGYYIVKQGTEVNGTVIFEDPVGEALSYTWLLDGSQIDTGEKLQHTFNKEPREKDLTVEVVESGGNVTSESVKVLVDNAPPTGQITVSNETIDEGGLVDFSASSFEDNGEIRDYKWNFSDGSEEQMGMNVSHTFELHGEYEVSVTVTDAVGNRKNFTTTITVNDTTKPQPLIRAKQDGKNITLDNITMGKLVDFSAEPSYDPAGYDGEKGELKNVSWEIEKLDISESGMTFNHTFDKMGEYTLKLTVEDGAGNNATLPQTINVVSGPAPNLDITNVEFSTKTPKVGKKVTITINITNYGTADASNVVIDFKKGGSPVNNYDTTYYTKNGTRMTNRTIKEGDTVQIKLKWTPDNKGNKSLSLNITDTEEPSNWMYDNEKGPFYVDVEPPKWREYAVYALIPIVIIGVTVGLYFYKDKIKEKLGK